MIELLYENLYGNAGWVIFLIGIFIPVIVIKIGKHKLEGYALIDYIIIIAGWIIIHLSVGPSVGDPPHLIYPILTLGLNFAGLLLIFWVVRAKLIASFIHKR